MPTNQDALDAILQARERGDLRSAEALARDYLANEPLAGEVYRVLGQVLLATERADEGIAALREALRCLPDKPDLYAELGRALAQQGATDEAVQLLGRASALLPERAELAVEAAETAMQGGRIGVAVEVLERARRAHPDDPWLMACFGRALARLGDEAGALASLRRAAELAPDDGVVQHMFAAELRRTGRDEAAVEAYRRALALTDCPDEARKGMADALMSLGRLDEAFEAYDACYLQRHGLDGSSDPGLRIFGVTTSSKLQHDIEQIEYLLETDRIDAGWRDQAEAYRRVLAGLPAEIGRHRMQVIPEDLRELIAGSYNKLWHKYEPDRQEGGALNPALHTAAVEQAYVGSMPRMVVVDELLRPEAHLALDRFCRESTFWHEFRYGDGCLGAALQAGFTCPLLLQLGEELGARLPGIFSGSHLRRVSALSCNDIVDSGTARREAGAVTVNLWLTPVADSVHGGLLVWDRPMRQHAPEDDPIVDAAAIDAFEAETGARSQTVACRDNRAVLLDAALPWRLRPAPSRRGFAQRLVLLNLTFADRREVG